MPFYIKHRTAVGMFLIWTLLICGSLTWNVFSARENIISSAYNEAVTLQRKDLSFRLWGASHGGVYLPVSDKQQPIEWLSHIKNRDVTLPDGQMLTLVNPAAMIRQVGEQYEGMYGVKGRITSLQPINSLNTPDEWETRQLQRFDKGLASESWEIVNISGEPYLNYLQAMVTEERCLKCHAEQGYKVGDIRGGIGIKLPLSGYYKLIEKTENGLILTHSVIWLIGSLGIVLYGRIIYQRKLEIQAGEEERKKAAEKVAHMAHHDDLTTLHNRYSLSNQLELALSKANRQGHKCALLFIDLDRFKTINDSLGHPFGDKLLQEVASRLSGILGKADMLARFGGDEFVLLRPVVNNTFEADALAKEVQDHVTGLYLIDGREVETSASTGICIYPDDGSSANELLKNADIAMYHAKESGRNNYQFFTDRLSHKADERLKLENLIRGAFADNQFELHYQPICDAVSHQVECVEVLIRWKHPEQGYIPPDRFIPVAEETGFILTLGDWVLEEACRTFSLMKNKGCPLNKIAINLSVKQLQSHSLVSKVRAAIQKYDILPNELELEITETTAMDDPDRAIYQLKKLNQLGVSLAIDDFGTGYSSLAQLKKLPIHTLKLDRIFVGDIGKGSNEEICTAAINLAHNLGLIVVAEGVETREQLDFLVKNKCELLQGYYFSKPLPMDELCNKFLANAST